MSRKTIYTDEPVHLGETVADFLPPPSQLVRRSDTVKVTLELNRPSLDFLKRTAKQQGVPYQRMLRSLVDEYARHHRSSAE